MKKSSKSWEYFVNGNVHENSFWPSKKYKPTGQAFWCTGKFNGIVGSSRNMQYIELPNKLSKNLKTEQIAEKSKEKQDFHNFSGQRVRKLI